MSADTEEAKAEHDRDIEIVVNAEQHLVHQRRLPFEDIVRLAFADAIFNDDIVYTVTYKRGPLQNRVLRPPQFRACGRLMSLVLFERS